MRAFGSATLLVLALVVSALLSVAAAPAAAAAPSPPPVSVDPPSGRRPGPTPGLRQPERCTPTPGDAGEAPPDAGTRLAAAHKLATGVGQVIAVIDTGVYPHEQLAGRLRPGGDYLTGGNGLDDCDGHGTAVAGILAAAPGKRGGVVGIAPGARLVAIRQSSPSFVVPGPDGKPRPAGDTATLADAIVFAVREGATVINISEAVCVSPEQGATAGAPVHAALKYAADADVVVVAAAGNLGVGSCAKPAGLVSLPGWFDELITVAAVGRDDAPAPFTVPGPWVDVAAPGTGLRSLAVGGGTTGAGIEGTSFATPWVAGLAALLRERYPKLTARQITDRIVATARRPIGGRDDVVGHGVVDPVAALTAVPAVLLPDEPAGAPRPSLELASSSTPPDSDQALPLDLIAAGVLLGAGGLAAWWLRRRPT